MADDIRQQIQADLAAGATKEEVFLNFLQKGYKADQINAAFALTTSPVSIPQVPEDTQGRTVNIIVTIGAILIGAGAFSFIAANWDAMSSTLKVVVILLSVLLTNVLGWYLKEKKGLPKSGSAFYILGNLLYGAGIFLIAQIFNVRENWPDGYMLWMLGSVLMAFALEEYSLFYLGALVGFIAVVGHPFILLDDPLSLTGFDFTPISLLVLTTIVAALTGWQVRKKVPQEQKGFF